MGIADYDTNCRKALILYRNISIFAFPLMSHALYIATSLVVANYLYDAEIALETSIRIGDVLSSCLAFWNGLLVLLSCFHLAYFVRSVFKLTKSINANHVDQETQSKAYIKMGTTMLHILVLATLTLNYFEIVVLDLLPLLQHQLQVNRAFTVQLFTLSV